MSKVKSDGTQEPPASGARNGAPEVDPATLDALGMRLRQSYQDVVDEGVPARFLELLDKLRGTNGPSGKGGA